MLVCIKWSASGGGFWLANVNTLSARALTLATRTHKHTHTNTNTHILSCVRDGQSFWIDRRLNAVQFAFAPLTIFVKFGQNVHMSEYWMDGCLVDGKFCGFSKCFVEFFLQILSVPLSYAISRNQHEATYIHMPYKNYKGGADVPSTQVGAKFASTFALRLGFRDDGPFSRNFEAANSMTSL